MSTALSPEYVNERRKELLKAGLELLRRDAENWGMVITVSQVPRVPLAMGNYDTVIEVREARK